MDRGAWWVIVRSVAKSRTRLKQLSTHTHGLNNASSRNVMARQKEVMPSL